MQYLLDTNILSYYLRKQYPALNTKFEDELYKKNFAISVISRAESLYGVALMQSADKRRVPMTQLIHSVPALAWEARHADLFAQLNAGLVQTGQTIGVFDAMIVAHALVENLILVTHNIKHFERIPNLKIEDWTQVPMQMKSP